MAEISKIKIGGVDYEIKDSVARAGIAAGLQFEVVSELPTASEAYMGKIYLVKHVGHNPSDNDIYDEYVVIRSGAEGSYAYAWEKLGNTDVNLENYAKKGHTHKVTSNVSVADINYTPAGENAASEVTFADNGDNKASVVSAIPSATVDGYALSDATKNKIKATASGADVNTVSKLVVASQDNVGSVTAGSDAELDGGSQASFTQGAKASFTQGAKAEWSAKVENEILSFAFTANGDDQFTANGDDQFVANTLQSIKAGTGKATQVTLPTFAEQTIATSIKSQPAIAIALDADGDVEVVTAQGALSKSGSNAVTFADASKIDVVKIGAKGSAAAQAFSGTAAVLQHSVTNAEVSTGASIAAN